MNYKLILFLSSVTIFSMQGCKPKNTQQIDSKTTGAVLIEEAAKLSYTYLKHPELSKIFNSYSTGGTLPAKYFEIKYDSGGVLFWFCYKPGNNPELFLAMEQLEWYDTTRLPQKPISNFLKKSKNLFKYNGSTSSSKDVINYFVTHTESVNEDEDIPNALVQQYVNSFDSLMNAKSDGKGKYCTYPFSFFDRRRDFEDGKFVQSRDYEDFISQTPKNGFVRYYLGFDENDSSNRIRVILFSTDSSGRNITKKRPSSKSNDALILQRSWPPPPQGI